jgi:S-methylmethionine-dependent homocysteine/selenocysteine methylase
MVNCAHPAHFADVLIADGPWHRIRAVRANASRMSHEELDNATELDRGDEAELASGYLALHEALPNLAVVGGCCGTDIRHIDAISAAFTKSS